MSYRPAAAGHTAHEESRDVTQGTLDELLVARAEEWLNGIGRLPAYKTAFELTKDIIVSQREAGLLALHPTIWQHEMYNTFGEFLSALYNHRCPENVILYPHNTPRVENLGYRLVPQKTLIITGTVGKDVGFRAAGPVIISGRTGKNTGQCSLGPFIITGNAGEFTGGDATGVFINLGPEDTMFAFLGTHITQEMYEKNVGLKTYVDQLLKLAKNDPLAIEAKFGDGVKITEEIKRLIGGTR